MDRSLTGPSSGCCEFFVVVIECWPFWMGGGDGGGGVGGCCGGWMWLDVVVVVV